MLSRILPSCLVFASGLAAILFDVTLSEAHDQNYFHVPVLLRFASELPAPNLVSYNATMTPLYHLVLAVFARAGFDSLVELRIATLVLSSLGVFGIQWFFARFTSEVRAGVYAATIGLSPYYLGAASFVVTDNPPFALMAVAMGLTLASPPRSAWMAVAVTAAALIRQIYVWLLAFVVFGAAARRPPDRGALLTAMRWMALPAALLGAFLLLWGGPLPRGFVAYRHPPGLLPLVAILASLGLWSAPLLPALLAGCDRRRAAVLFVAIAVPASVLLIAQPITDSYASPWGGGMRTLGKYVGTLAGTSIIYWLCMWAGSLTAAVLVARDHAAYERTLLAAFAFWAAAQCLNAALGQRYYDPFLLMMLFAFAARLRSRAATYGTAALVAAVLLASFVRLVVHGGGLVHI